MAYLKIPKINPIALMQSNSSYESIRPLFIDALKNFEIPVEFYQKWQNSDTIIVQYSTDDIDTTASMKLVGCDNEYNFTITQLTPNIEYVGGKRFYKSQLALSGVVEGYYQVHFNITIDGKTYYFTSEPMHVAATQDNTTLIKYTHDSNMFDALFLNSLSNEYFYLRIIGGYKYSDITPASKDEIFIDMNQQSTQLDVRPYDLYKFTFGDCAGLPFWMIEIVRYAIGLNEIYFDNVRFCKFEGAKFEKEQIDSDNYPMCSYSIDMQKIPQDYAIEFNENEYTSPTDTLFGTFELTISNTLYGSRKALIEVMPSENNVDLYINWGDGNTNTYTVSPGYTYGTPLSHTYLADGNYNVTITILGDTLDKIKGIGCGNYPGGYGFALKSYSIADMSELIYTDLRYNNSTHQTSFVINGSLTKAGFIYLQDGFITRSVTTLTIQNTITFDDTDPIWNTQRISIVYCDKLDLNSTNLFSKLANVKYISINTCKNIDLTIGSGNATLETLMIQNNNSVSNVSLDAALINIGNYTIKNNTTPLSEANVNAVLIHADTYSAKVGAIDLTGGAAPSGAGATAKTSLQGKGWTVITS